MRKVEKRCLGCERKLIRVKDRRDVEYWKKMVELKGGGIIYGYTQVDENFVRITYSSPPIAEIWIKIEEIPLGKCCRSLCPLCMKKDIEERKKRKGE